MNKTQQLRFALRAALQGIFNRSANTIEFFEVCYGDKAILAILEDPQYDEIDGDVAEMILQEQALEIGT